MDERTYLTDPISMIQWVDAATLHANLYNPNVVMQTEFALLERSLLSTGWVQPILVTPARTVIDGFHRWKLSMNSPAVRAKYHGMVPAATLHVTEGEAMFLTIRMNRAKGSHLGLRMSEIIRTLVDTHGFPLERIAPEIGASLDEMKLLYSGGVFKFKDSEHHKYSRSWTPAENGRTSIAEPEVAPSAPWDDADGRPPLTDPVPCALSDITPWAAEAARDRVALKMTADTRWWWIRGAGCIGLTRLRQGGVRMIGLWVRPQLRGLGYGRLLRDAVILTARREVATFIEGYATLPEAYVKLGFGVEEVRANGSTTVRLGADDPLTLEANLEPDPEAVE